MHLLRDAVGTRIFSAFSHPDLGKSRICRDKRDVESLAEMLDSNWINPFLTDGQDLLIISSGIAATENVTKDLLQGLQRVQGRKTRK